MIMKKVAIIVLAGFLPLSVAHAQKDSTLNRTVVVENEYNPDIMDASKINVLPKVEEPAVVKKGIEYATALRPVSAWNYEEMSPITRKWMMENAKRGYVRAGYGNYGNVDFKASYLWDITKNDRLQVATSLDGMNGTLNGYDNEDWKSRFYASAFRIGYGHSFNRFDLNLGGSIGSQVFNYMPGAPIMDGSYISDKQHFSLGDFYVGIASNDETLPLQFRVETGFKYFGVKYPFYNDEKVNEKNFHIGGDVWGKISEEQRVGIKFEMDNLFYTDSLMSNYTSLCLNPYYAIEEDSWRLRLGAHVDWQSGNGSGINVAPDVKAEYIFSDSYVLYLHALGGRQLNDYHRLNALTPYWGLSRQLPSTYVPLDATLGFKASPVNGLWFNLFGGYRIAQDELFSYLTNAENLINVGFYQDKAKVGYGGAEVKYGHKDWFDASLKGTFYSWNTDHEETESLSMKPKFELNFRAEAKVIDGLRVNLGYDYIKREKFLFAEHLYQMGDVDMVSNLSVGATYMLLKDLSVFAKVNNLFNKQYYYESGYPAEKLNVIGGLSYRF